MKRETLYEIKAMYRDDFRVEGLRFGSGKHSMCVLGSTRGNEHQQIYCCSLLVERLRKLEMKGLIKEGHEILVIPCANPYSVNVKKRFWGIDNTDINRMFPGYKLGETTQRIAAGIFDAISDYTYGVQFASYYMRGSFMPHIRLMKTGYEDVELAKTFGMPFVVLRDPRPFDTATLNYNWQIWETKAFSIYTTHSEVLDKEAADLAVEAILNFMSKQGIIDYDGYDGYVSRVITDDSLLTIRADAAGIFEGKVKVGERVKEGKLLAKVRDPYLGEVITEIHAPEDGVVMFAHDEAMCYDSTAVYKLVRRSEV